MKRLLGWGVAFTVCAWVFAEYVCTCDGIDT